MISKRVIFRIHRWCGLAAAAFVLLEGITGCILVYRAPLAEVIDPVGMVRRTGSGDASFQAIVQAVQQADSGYRVKRIRFPVTPRGVYFARLGNKAGGERYASIDPSDGRILRQGNIWKFPTEAALQIHERLMAGTPGIVAVICLGALILATAVTGLIYWWPRAGRWGKSLILNWRLPPRLLLRHAHRSVAVVASGFIGVAVVTGVILTVGTLVDHELTFPKTSQDKRPPLQMGIDQGLALARASAPGRGIRDIRLPATDQLHVYFWAPERNPTAVHLVGVDLATGRIAGIVPARDNPGLWVIPFPIHTGEDFGPVGQFLAFFAGAGLVALSASGFVMWLQIPRKR